MSSKRKEAKDDGDEGKDRWLVSYADFITLMFAFFAVLYATSQKDMDKTKEFQESLKRYLIKAGAFGESGQQMNQGIKNNSPIEPPIQTFNPSKPEAAKTLDEAETFVETQLSKEEQAKYILDVVSDDWGVRITIPSGAIFSGESEKFREDALPFIARLSGLVAKTKRKVLIEGHVRENEKGAFRSSWDFSSARSLNLLRYMQQKEKFASSQLAAAAFGDSRPIMQNQDPEKNSRLEVILLNSDIEL